MRAMILACLLLTSCATPPTTHVIGGRTHAEWHQLIARAELQHVRREAAYATAMANHDARAIQQALIDLDQDRDTLAHLREDARRANVPQEWLTWP